MSEREGTCVVFSGGGTGGHLYPALALADALVELRPDVRPYYVGASRGVEARVLPERGLPHALLPVSGLARRGGLGNLGALPRLVRSVFRCLDLFRELRPRAVVITGGYASGPAGIAAALMRIPLAIQEQNAVPGRVVRALSRVADQVHVAFPEAAELLPAGARPKARVSGNPVRPPAGIDGAAARTAFGIPADATVLLVVGGSQGSLTLNSTLRDAVVGVTRGELERPTGLHILWSTGPRHFEGVAEAMRQARDPEWVHPVPYIDEMPTALAAADFALSRAGAMATAELLNHGLPSVLVPLPTAAADHQRHNAESLEEAGAAVVAPEAELRGEGLWRQILDIAGDDERRERMSGAGGGRGRPGATPAIAADLATLLPPPPAS